VILGLVYVWTDIWIFTTQILYSDFVRWVPVWSVFEIIRWDYKPLFC
jgi:hypothetical protein